MGGGLYTHHAMWGLGVSVRLAFGQSRTLCAQRIGCWDPFGLGIGFDGFQACNSPPVGAVGGACATQVCGQGRAVSVGDIGCGASSTRDCACEGGSEGL